MEIRKSFVKKTSFKFHSANQKQYNKFQNNFDVARSSSYQAILRQLEVASPGNKACLTMTDNRRIDMNRMFGFLIGITVGGLVGSTIALLMAPDSGELLRYRLRERGQNFFYEVRHAADERKIELRQRLEDMRTPREG
jgi:PAS domain-containing protein